MAPKRPNYSQERSDRNRSKERKKQARLQRRAEDSEKRKAERSGSVGNRALPPGGNR